MTNTHSIFLATLIFAVSCSEKEDDIIDTSTMDTSDTEDDTDSDDDSTETGSDETDTDPEDTADDTNTDTDTNSDTDTDDTDTDTDTDGPVNELTENGDFELGDISGWTDYSATNNGTFSVVSTTVSSGSWAGNIVANVTNNGPASFPVVKQANLGEGF